jgi:hypothetical protein
MAKTTRCTASVWPHRRTDELTGPLDLTISYKNQHPLVQEGFFGRYAFITLVQPDDKTNLTLMQLVFAREHYTFCPYSQVQQSNKVRVYRKGRSKAIKVYIRSRLTNKMDHPIPLGAWEGTLSEDNSGPQNGVVYTFQAMTAKVVKKKPLIILPGEEGFVLP